MTDSSKAIALGPGEGEKMSAMGVDLTYKAVSADNGGPYFCMEYGAPPGWAGPPKHVHNNMDEVFYVVEGEVTVYMGDQEVKGTPGSFIQVPRGMAHTFANWGETRARYLILILPGSLEGYFDELPELVARHGYPPPAEVMEELAQKYDMAMVGPRPAGSLCEAQRLTPTAGPSACSL